MSSIVFFGVPETGTQTAHEIVLQNVGYPVCGAHGGFLHVFVSEELVALGRYGTCHALVFGILNMCSEVSYIQRGWERAGAGGGAGYKWAVGRKGLWPGGGGGFNSALGRLWGYFGGQFCQGTVKGHVQVLGWLQFGYGKVLVVF